jgi:hypothetical protein
MKEFQELYKIKGSDIAVFLGSGSSINRITNEQWEKISEVDTWTVNNWVYHPFVPKFYNLEVKGIDKKIITERFLEKEEEYNNTHFIVDKSKKLALNSISTQKNVYLYNLDIMDDVDTSKHNPKIKYEYKVSSDPNTLIAHNLCSSLTLILDFLWRFGYEKVIFFGVDMHDSRYFWTNRPEYGKTHCQYNHDHKKNKKIEQPHTTFRIKDFIIWFSEEWMSKIDCKLFVGHKDTILYPDLKYFDIENLKGGKLHG